MLFMIPCLFSLVPHWCETCFISKTSLTSDHCDEASMPQKTEHENDESCLHCYSHCQSVALITHPITFVSWFDSQKLSFLFKLDKTHHPIYQWERPPTYA
jgi:hypothetical protein